MGQARYTCIHDPLFGLVTLLNFIVSGLLKPSLQMFCDINRTCFRKMRLVIVEQSSINLPIAVVASEAKQLVNRKIVIGIADGLVKVGIGFS